MKVRALLLLLITLLTGCSSGSGSDTALNDDGGIGGTGVTSGPIQGFGKLRVNDIQFEIDESTVIIEDSAPIPVPDSATLQSYLKRGMIVRIEGEINRVEQEGVAHRISYEDAVQGTISKIDSAARQMTVLDRTIRVDESTVIGDENYPRHTLDEFQVGHVVEISGLTAADGTIRATWIGLLRRSESNPTPAVETSGIVENNNPATETFYIGATAIRYGGIPEAERPNLADGAYVEVRGILGTQGIDATYIELQAGDVQWTPGDQILLDGLVTRVTSGTEFDVDNRRIVTQRETLFEGGISSDLRLDMRVRVSGVVDETGQFVAQKVLFQDKLKPLEVLLVRPGQPVNQEGEGIALQIVVTDLPEGVLVYHADGLPPHFTLDASTGLITGVLSCESAGIYPVTISLERYSNPPTVLTWTVEEACTVLPISITSRPPILASLESHDSPEGSAVRFSVTATDPDGDPLAYRAAGLPPGLIMDATTGLISGTVPYTASGAYTVTVCAADPAGLSTCTAFSWTLSHTNRPPEIVRVGDPTSLEGETGTLTVVATDPDGDVLNYSAAGMPKGLSMDGATGLISGTLSCETAGVYDAVVTVTDSGGLDASTSFVWTVEEVCNPPVMTDPSDQTHAEGNTVSLQINATDAAGEILTYGVTALPPTLAINSTTGLITGVLSFDAEGVYTVTVTVTDDDGLRDEATFRWTISNTNRSPILSDPGNQSSTEGDAVSFSVVANDPDGDLLSYAVTGLPSGLVIDATTGKITGTLDCLSAATYTVGLNVTDGSLETTKNFIWTVSEACS